MVGLSVLLLSQPGFSGCGGGVEPGVGRGGGGLLARCWALRHQAPVRAGGWFVSVVALLCLSCAGWCGVGVGGVVV